MLSSLISQNLSRNLFTVIITTYITCFKTSSIYSCHHKSRITFNHFLALDQSCIHFTEMTRLWLRSTVSSLLSFQFVFILCFSLEHCSDEAGRVCVSSDFPDRTNEISCETHICQTDRFSCRKEGKQYWRVDEKQRGGRRERFNHFMK